MEHQAPPPGTRPWRQREVKGEEGEERERHVKAAYIDSIKIQYSKRKKKHVEVYELHLLW